jgi:very-short-patch-repair endonuclease
MSRHKNLRTLQDWITFCNRIHKNKYDYSQITELQYIKSMKVKIKCPLHGYFYQDLRHHQDGHGCPKCRDEFLSVSRRYDKKYFIKCAKEIHGNKYDYSKVEYKNYKTPVEIICKEHGSFWCSPSNHISQSNGCPKCSGKNLSVKDYIKIFNRVHKNKYDYSLFTSVNKYTDIIKIICPVHGVFTQKISNHKAGCGCTKCNKIGHSKISQEVISCIEKKTRLKFYRASTTGEFTVKSKKGTYRVDGYNKRYNIVIEFNGDAYHGNLKVFNKNTKCNPYNNFTALKLNKITKNRVNFLRKKGYRVIEIWENDWMTNKKKVLNNVIDRINLWRNKSGT